MTTDNPENSPGGSGRHPLDLDDYRALVRLDEPFSPPLPSPEPESDRAESVGQLLEHLRSDGTARLSGIDMKTVPTSCEEMRRLLRALLTVRTPDPLPSWFHEKLDRLLQLEARAREVADSGSLPRIAETLPATTYGAASQCALWRGDITALRIDAIVNAANEYLLGCFRPFHACIDNVIHSWAGPRLREDCHAIMQLQGHSEGTGLAKVTRGYNLPAGYVLHTVGPIIDRRGPGVSREQEQQLSDCYRSCLDLAARIPTIRSVAFCCISTGVFGFPQEPAARIALRTVDQWLADHPGALDLIVFNVFRLDDLQIYESALKNW